MFKNITISVGSFILAVVLFSTPLWLKYHVFKPRHVSIHTGETIEVKKGISTIWCESESVTTSSSSFDAFVVNTTPTIDMSTRERSTAVSSFSLTNKKTRVFNYRLLKGSTVTISACVRLSGAYITLLRGRRNMERCLVELEDVFVVFDLSDEESESEESDEATSSISSSQGGVSNETERIQECTEALGSYRLQPTYKCDGPNTRPGSRTAVFSHSIDISDEYFFIFDSDTYLDILPNEFSVDFVFDRTHLNYTTAAANCTNSTYCELPISFASSETVFVDVRSKNGSWTYEEVMTSCLPRKSIFFLFYLGFTIIIFLCAFY